MQGMYKSRLISERFKKMLDAFPCVLVLGARQVGKSTLIRHLMETSEYVVFDPSIDIENARQYPDLFLQNHRTPLLLDEIQFVPELVSSLKRVIDANRKNGQYVLTGSQQWQIMTRLSESLAGRVGILELYGFSLGESLGTEPTYTSWLERWLADPEAFISSPSTRFKLKHSLYETLWRGFLPEACEMALDVVSEFHRSYQSTYIERDIRQMGDVGDWHTFGRFVQLLGALSGQEINYSQLGREIGINPATARHWTALLTGTYQWFAVPAFSTNTIKRISQKPKGFLSDTGLVCFSQRIPSPESLGGHPLLGAIFESAVVSEIRKLSTRMSTPPQLYHWRANGGAEVDLILEWNQTYYPVEIKINPHPSRKDTSGMTAFRKAYPNLHIQKGLVIAPTASFFPLSDLDYAMPWDLV